MILGVAEEEGTEKLKGEQSWNKEQDLLNRDWNMEVKSGSRLWVLEVGKRKHRRGGVKRYVMKVE